MPATGQYSVVAGEFTAIEVTPPQLNLATGETVELKIQGVGPHGRRPLADHPDLKVNVAGEQPKRRSD